MAPFPLCCVAGMASAESVATLAAAACGLTTGADLSLLVSEVPDFSDKNAPVAALVAEHKKIAARQSKVQAPLVVLGAAGAAAAAAANRDKHAAAPLAVAAACNLLVVALSLTLIRKAEKEIEALPVPNGSPSKKDAKAAAADDKARGLLQRWAGLHSARTALAGFAFGSALCGVLLLNKKN